MNNHEIIKKLNQTLHYLRERKNYLFHQIEQTRQNLENINTEIQEQETYMELENQKEQQETNIFNLYDTTNKYAEERKILAGKIAGMNVEKNKFEILLDALQKEFNQVNEQIISNQILVKQFSEQHNSSRKGEKNKHNHMAKEQPEQKNQHADLADRLEFCLGILQLDKERCSLELQSIIQELKSM